MTGIEPMSHAQDVVPALRDDKVTERDRHQDYRKIARGRRRLYSCRASSNEYGRRHVAGSPRDSQRSVGCRGRARRA
jgi:hypothetical protein